MTGFESYQGTVAVNQEVVPYRVMSQLGNDGSAIRELTLLRTPYRPTELLSLMQFVAPVAEFSDVNDIKVDMGAMLNTNDTPDPFFQQLRARHSHAFGEYWKTMSGQAQAIYDALPFRYSEPYLRFRYGEENLAKAIKSIKHSTYRSQLLADNRLGLAVAHPFNLSDEGALKAPETPFITVPTEAGVETYVKKTSLDLEEDTPRSADYGLTADGLGKVVFDKVGHRIPVWETHHIPNIGISPAIRWKREGDGSLLFVHGAVETGEQLYDGVAWQATSSSVIGCLALAAVTPEVTQTWKARQGYRKDADRTQRMGALQSTLLSVVAANKLLEGSFIQHIEENLAA